MNTMFTKHFRRKITEHGAGIFLICLLIYSVNKVNAAGYFELEILEISNANSHILTGYCCGVPLEIRSTKTTGCPPCSTAFRLCLKEYQNSPPAEHGTSFSKGCSFGNATSSILGGSSFVLSNPNMGAIVLPFTFRWTKSFTLVLQAVDMYNTSYPDSERIIEEAFFSGMVLPSPEWQTLDFIGQNALITYRVRVQCAHTYYNTTCTTFCRSRNDRFGHYTCGPEGQKLCLNGWQGINCENAICKSGCDPTYGKCDSPGECECRPGWNGPLCNECAVYPGCKHGSCNGSAWKCVCDTNWGGMLCDQDLNYCGTHEPCMHGGTCENTAPDEYRCTCAEGLSGIRCEIVEHPCATQPCKNGGICKTIKELTTQNITTSSYQVLLVGSASTSKALSHPSLPTSRHTVSENSEASHNKTTLQAKLNKSRSNGPAPGNVMQLQHNQQQMEFTCTCTTGWTGPTCDINIDECADGPCRNGGTCIDLIDGFRCECSPEWTGDMCQVDVNECELMYALTSESTTAKSFASLPVIQADVTRNSSTFLKFLPTSGPCINAVKCVNQPGSFKCLCIEGWFGPTCAQNKDDCVVQCKNGATCIDLVNDYHCACAAGFTGRDCETDINECANLPCRNDGECVDMVGKFKCICPLGYSGSLCEEAKDHCISSPCLHGRCLNTPGSYYCHCPPSHAGKHCEKIRPLCSQPQCNEGCLANATGNAMPCNGHGTCEFGEVGAYCKCHIGHTGNFCEENLNECSSNPCRNGGICLETDGNFICKCLSGWTGTHCSESITECYEGQCQNGGSCIIGFTEEREKYHCRCATGWGGSFCTEVVDQCLGQPCHNNGTCEAGQGWFRCLCAQGFSGPDCRININECSPQPCEGGATCIDGIGGYTCICPNGRYGTRCEILLSDSKLACINVSNIVSPYHPLNQTNPDWLQMALSGRTEEYCNACICENGTSRCTNLWCGLPNCFKKEFFTKSSNRSRSCKQHEVCVPTLTETCISPPCTLRGDCRAVEPSRRVAPPQLPTSSDCWPNQATLQSSCARLSILLDLQTVIAGSSVEGLCSVIRFLLASRLVTKLTKTSHNEDLLIIICDLKTGTNDTIEMTVSSSQSNDLQMAVTLLGDLLSSRQLNYLRDINNFQNIKIAPLISILEVKVETALIAENNTSLLSAILIILIGIALFIVIMIMYRLRLANRSASSMNIAPSLDVLRCEDEKSNNLQNEENLRRYQNPLKGSTTSLGLSNCMESSLSPAPDLTVISPLASTSASIAHRSQPLYHSTCDTNFDCELDTCNMSRNSRSSGSKKFRQIHRPQHDSQVLLHKTQNLDIKNNTVSSLDSPHKDFDKSSIICKSMPPAINCIEIGGEAPPQVKLRQF